MKRHGVVGVFWLVLGRWVGRVSEPTAGRGLGQDRWTWVDETSGLLAW